MRLSRRKIFSKRFLSLFLAAAMCVGLLQLPVLADGDCEYGQEGCVCTEETCLEVCTVCHPVEGDEEDGEPPAGETDPSPAPVNLEDEGGEAPAMASNSLPASASLEDEAENLRAAIEGEASTYTLAGDVTGSFEIPAGKTFALNLGGYTLHGGTDSNYVIVNRGDLTLKNGTVENGARYGVANTATLTMANVRVRSYDCGVTGAAGTLTLEDCDITVTAPSGGQPYGVYGQSDCTIILKNTKVSSAFVGVYTSQDTAIDVTITGGAVYGGSCAAINQWGAGTITVSNCALTSDKSKVIEHNRGVLELKNGTSLYGAGKPGVIGSGDLHKNPLDGVTMDATVVINETSKVHTVWTEYVTGITENDYVKDDAAKEVHIKSPAGLAWWAKQANSNISFAGYTVLIEDDLDMGGYEWKAVTLNAGKVTIDGRDHTIRNLLIPATGYTHGRGFIHDIADDFTIQNVTFDAATVGVAGSGNIVGVILGYTAEAGKTVTMENVKVTNSVVQGLGKVGGLIGMGEGCDVVLTNCSVTNTTISGIYNCGGLVGLAQGKNTVDLTDCTAEATWEPTGTKYVCLNGKAVREYTSENELALPIEAQGVYWYSQEVESDTWGMIPVLFAAWGEYYTDYEQYLTTDVKDNHAGIYGFCHPANLHTHIELTGTKCVDTGDGVSHKIVCAGCGADLKDLGYPHEPHTFKDNRCEKCGAEKHVARIGETLYTTIQAAVDAVPNDTPTTIEMINDSDLSAVIPAGKTITLNVNGKTLTDKKDDPDPTKLKTVFTNSGNLTINGPGNIENHNTKWQGGGDYCLMNNSVGVVYLNEGITLQNPGNGDYVVWNQGIMEINGGRILKEKHASWDAVCNGRGAPNARLTINYCEITAKAEGDSCIGNQGATTIINGGVFRAQLPVENGITENPIDGPESRLTINGGKFIREDGPKPDGTINSVNNCAVLLVTGGDFYAVNMEKPIFLINSRSTSSTATVSGGTFYRGDIFHNGYCGETGCTVTDPGSLYAFNGKDYDGTTDAVRWQIGTPAMSLDKTAVTLSRNGTDTLTPVLDPNNAIYTAAEWSSDDTGVATVDANGVVTAHEPGTAAITCKVKVKTAVKDGTSSELVVVETELTAACTVTVSNSYTLTYNANGTGVTNLPGDQSGTGTVTISAQRPARGGYTFRGWAAAPGGAAVYQPGGSIDLTGSVTLYAVWTANSSGGSGSGGSGGSGGGGGGSGGRGGGTNPVTIIDEEVPLAGDLLNKVDHFAYIAGYDDGTVRPNNPLTRAQVATIFYRLLTDLARDIYFQETNSFPDVPDDFWACKAISTLTNAGILGGFEDGTFRPNAYITRAQFAAMAARFDSVVPGLANPFSDVAEDYWARDLIAYAAFQGWVEGGGTFRPLENITRAEAMGFLNNVLERRVDAEGLVEGYTTFTDVPAGDPWYYVVAEATNTHDYTRREEGQPLENWTGLLENPVWDE